MDFSYLFRKEKPGSTKAGLHSFRAFQDHAARAPDYSSGFGNVTEDAQRLKSAAGPSIVTNAKFFGTVGEYYALVGTTGVVLQLDKVRERFRRVGGFRRLPGAQDAFLALDVPAKFAEELHERLKHELNTSEEVGNDQSHFFFVYSPENDWHPRFWKLNEAEPLGTHFCGFSDDLPALCLWMRFIRVLIDEMKVKYFEKYRNREYVFHLFIATYRPSRLMVLIVFASKLHPLVLHGMSHPVEGLIRLNIPWADRDSTVLHRVENIHTRPTFGEFLRGLPGKLPVLLGQASETADSAAREEIRNREKRKNDNGVRKTRR